jgi:uncharacterized protein YciI
MDFLVIAYDGTDEGALERRMKVREAHLAQARRLKKNGHLIEGGALLNPEGKMIGSTLYVRFDTAEDLHRYLGNDPYTTGHVWLRTEVYPIKLAKLD